MMEPPKIWRERTERYLGIGIQCLDCENKSFPRVQICPSCESENLRKYKIAREGKIKLFTKVLESGTERNFYSPYILGLIELDDGITVTAQIVDCEHEEIKENMRVRMTFRVLAKDKKEGLIQYGFKFSLINS